MEIRGDLRPVGGERELRRGIRRAHEVFRQKDSSESALGDHLFDLVALPAFLQSAAEFQRGIRIQIDGLNRFM